MVNIQSSCFRLCSDMSMDKNWNLSEYHGIPNSAIVESMKITTKERRFFSQKFVAVSNQFGESHFIEVGLEFFHFSGEEVKQIWSVATIGSDCNLKFVINWFDPISQTSGSIEQLGSQRLDKDMVEEGGGNLKVQTDGVYYQSAPLSRPVQRKSFQKHLKDKITKAKRDEFIRSDVSIILESEPIGLVNPLDNSISMQKGIAYSLGLINGKELSAMLLPEGGIDTNFNPRFEGPIQPGEPLTEEQQKALAVYQSYSKEEHEEAAKRTGIFVLLYQIVKGKMTVDHFNRSNRIKDFERFANSIGLKLEEPFLINGRKFYYFNNTLIEM